MLINFSVVMDVRDYGKCKMYEDLWDVISRYRPHEMYSASPGIEKTQEA